MKFEMRRLYDTKESKYPGYRSSVGGINLGRDIFGTFETINTLDKIGEVINIFTARAIISVVSDLLAQAQPRVPLQPDWADWSEEDKKRFPEKEGVVGGKLRESGRAWIKFHPGHFMDVAWGNKAGGVTVDPSRGGALRSKIKGVTGIEGNVGYGRLNEYGEDIAQWTHEDLNPYGSTSRPKARTPGTGPKYLELPWLTNRTKYWGFLKSALSGYPFETNLSKLLNKRTKRTKGYTISYYDVNLERAERIGYFESAFGLK